MSGTFMSILLMAALVLFSAFFSATETAFSSLNRTRLRAMAADGNRRAERTVELAEKYDKLISTILIGNNVVNIALASIGTVLFVRLMGDAGASVSTVVVTVVVLIFGEITPKSVAKDCPERFAMFASPMIRGLIVLLTPLNYVFSCWKKLVARVFHLRRDDRMSQAELLMLVEDVERDGSIDAGEGQLLKNAIEFTEREAEDILTHRVDLEAVPIDADKQEVARVFSESRYSRILAYEEDIDHILGVIHQKDFYTGSGITKKPLRDIVTPTIFVLKGEKISFLLRQMQKTKSQVAVVLDEYGGTYGIVTMEDILEELVGEIWDEHDEVTVDLKKTGPDTYLADGAMALEDFCDAFDVECQSDVVSLSGWIMEKLEKIPVEGDGFRVDDLSVTVKSMDGHRVATVEIRKDPDSAPGEEE